MPATHLCASMSSRSPSPSGAQPGNGTSKASFRWFSRALQPWYAAHRRDLPWRRAKDPYRVWLSEVILQQTRVDQGTAYWERFVRRWPNVKALAQATEAEVLKEWQGLGYYSRARNLRAAAQQVLEQFNGRFPATHTALRSLKGVGDYTAAAIASICFDQPEAVVDGNVYRVLARVFGIATPIDSAAGKREFQTLADALVDPHHPGDHNQAVMELGATVCTPKAPACQECPLARRCIARSEGRIAALPVKGKKTSLRIRHFNYLIIRAPQGVLMRQRNGKDIWQGLWELPMLETDKAGTPGLLKNAMGTKGRSVTILTFKKAHGPVEHVLSHQKIMAVLWHCSVPLRWKAPADWRPFNRKDLRALPIHRLMERWMSEL